ncbi:MAG: hypothetical protein QXO27_04290 [Candidatus Aenigmatarchaeota archaeon]
MKWKYIWDDGREKDFSRIEAQVMMDIARMISYGCAIKDAKAKFKQIEAVKQ